MQIAIYRSYGCITGRDCGLQPPFLCPFKKEAQSLNMSGENGRSISIWQTGTLLTQDHSSQTDGLNYNCSDQNLMQNSHVDVVSKTLGDARKAITYRKCLLTEADFLKVFLEVNGMCENRLFFDSSKSPKMDPVSMTEKSWPN